MKLLRITLRPWSHNTQYRSMMGPQFFKTPELTPEELATYSEAIANCGEVYLVSNDEIAGQLSIEDYLSPDDAKDFQEWKQHKNDIEDDLK